MAIKESEIKKVRMADLDKPNFKIEPEVSHQIIEILQMNSSSGSADSDEDVLSDNYQGKDIQRTALAAYRAKQATNREAFGTWNRPLDFTLTLVGYIVGIHNFFRFPHLCYKYGALTFLIPYTIMMIVIGIPAVFMECTIGQYYGVGSITAFRHLAPIITGVSYVLAWNSFINCWMYGILLTWMRVYSGDSLSCLKGWIGCHEDHYYNTPYCWTGIYDQCCMNPNMDDFEGQCPFPKSDALGNHSIYFNYKCTKTEDFCKSFGSSYVPETKDCFDPEVNKSWPVYRFRFHATHEFFYGYVLGLKKVMASRRKKIAETKCQSQFNATCSSLNKSDTKGINDELHSEEHIKVYWSEEGQRLEIDPESSSSIQLPTFAFTTCLFITFFLFDNLLSVSAMTYILNGFPFLILTYLCLLALQFPSASKGIEEIVSLRGLKRLSDIEIWADSIVQVLVTIGVGNGALISLSSFNKYHHRFLFDVIFVTILNIITSILATIICFCTIGHYIREYEITEEFEDFIRPDSHYSSVEFSYIVYSHYLTQINGQDITTLLFFFTISSFPTDTAIRLAQNVLDAMVQILPRLKFHSTMALLGLSIFYLLTLLPVMRNGGITLFMEYEYYALRFAIPIITFIEVVSIGWVYTASRVVDNAEQLNVVSHHLFRKFFIFTIKYAIPVLLVFAIVCNWLKDIDERFRSVKSIEYEIYSTCFGWLFCLTPILLFLLSALKQLAAYPKSKWKDLFHPHLHSHGYRQALHRSRRTVFNSFKRNRKFGLIEPDSTDTEQWIRRESKSINLENENDGTMDFVQWDKGKIMRKSKEDAEGKRRSTKDADGVKRRSTKDKKVDEVSIDSTQLASLKSYLFWHGIMTYLEDWPDRLDDTEVESEGSSVVSSDENINNNHNRRKRTSKKL